MFRLRHPLLYTFADDKNNSGSSGFKIDIKEGAKNLNKLRQNGFNSENNEAIGNKKVSNNGNGSSGRNGKVNNNKPGSSGRNGKVNNNKPGSSGRNGEENKEVAKATDNNVSHIAGVSDADITNAYTSYNRENSSNNGNGSSGNGSSGNGNGTDQQQPTEENSFVKNIQKLRDNYQNTIDEKKKTTVDKIAENLNPKESVKDPDATYYDFKNKAQQAQRNLDRVKKGAGVQKWAAAGGAVLGAVGRYRQALKEWEYECQRAAAEGRPMPKKPSLLGSAIVGGIGGAIGGAGVGFVAKRMSSHVRDLDQALKISGQNRRIERDEGLKKNAEIVARYKALGNNDAEKEANYNKYRAELEEKARKKQFKVKSTVNRINQLSDIISKGTAIGQDATLDQLAWLDSVMRSDSGKEILMNHFKNWNKVIKFRDDLHAVQHRKAAFFSMYDNLAYIGQCFSLVEELEEKAHKDVEDWKELYNFYILNICDEPIPVNDFLLECYYYPNFIEYVEDAIVNFYQKKLVTFSSLGGIQKELDQYQDLYNEYRNLVGTNLTATEFIDRCITYESYVKYIYDKIKRTRLRRLGAMHFANPQSTSLPQNIQIDGQNIDTTQQGLPDPKDANSMQNQNSIQNKQQDAKNRQAQLERQKQEQQKKQQIEINKANYAKEQHAKEVNEINKLTQKKAEISKNLGRNASDMPMQQLAEQKQKITDLNFKIQNVKAETKNKIANYQGKSSKQFSLRKPV